jgi:hypothetical protein
MDMNDSDNEARESIWFHRRRRMATGANVATAALLAALLLAMVNYLASAFYSRWDWSSARLYALSDKSIKVLGSVNSPIDVYVVYDPDHESYYDLRCLLSEYAYRARHTPSHITLDVHYVEPDRDLAAMNELKLRHGLEERNSVVVSSGTRARTLLDRELYDRAPMVRTRVAFNGERMITSAIHDVAQSQRPVVYFLMGHGERDLENYDRLTGYSSIRRAIKRDNIELRPFIMAETDGIPGDCDALIVAGPTTQVPDAEVEHISRFLDRNGRVMILVDPFVRSGLELLLDGWGVRLATDVVIDRVSLTGGREFYVGRYGRHKITTSLKNVATIFSMPRSVEPQVSREVPDSERSDKPRVQILALTSKSSWAKRDFRRKSLSFDPDVDRLGPVSLAVAVEKGAVEGVDVALEPSRIVVVGDSDLGANQSLDSGAGGNEDFFMNCLNWLLARESLLAISPKPLGSAIYQASRDQFGWTLAALVGGIPLCVCMLGVLIWVGRRRGS